MDKLALLADNGSNGAFCYGAAVRDWRGVDFLRQPVTLVIDGKEVASAVGGNAAGHPRRLLGWLANHCARRGRGIAAGDIVTTGTHTGLLFAAPGGRGDGRASPVWARRASPSPLDGGRSADHRMRLAREGGSCRYCGSRRRRRSNIRTGRISA